MKKTASILLPLGALMMVLSSCAITTNATNGTSDSLQNTSDATTDSSGGDHHEARNQKVKAFTAANFDRLREDMARGGGEHLASLAYLLGIGKDHRADFFALAKENYPVLFSSEPTTPEVFLARLGSELNEHPEWMR